VVAVARGVSPQRTGRTANVRFESSTHGIAASGRPPCSTTPRPPIDHCAANEPAPPLLTSEKNEAQGERRLIDGSRINRASTTRPAPRSSTRRPSTPQRLPRCATPVRRAADGDATIRSTDAASVPPEPTTAADDVPHTADPAAPLPGRKPKAAMAPPQAAPAPRKEPPEAAPAESAGRLASPAAPEARPTPCPPRRFPRSWRSTQKSVASGRGLETRSTSRRAPQKVADTPRSDAALRATRATKIARRRTGPRL
jgi:hypothetical protein